MDDKLDVDPSIGGGGKSIQPLAPGELVERASQAPTEASAWLTKAMNASPNPRDSHAHRASSSVGVLSGGSGNLDA